MEKNNKKIKCAQWHHVVKNVQKLDKFHSLVLTEMKIRNENRQTDEQTKGQIKRKTT